MAHLAKMLAHHLGSDSVKTVPLEFTQADQLARDQHLVLLYPIHGFNAPRNVKQFVKSIPPGLYDTVSLIAVGCTTSWVNHAVSADLRKPLTKKGYPIVLDEILAMPLTYILSFPDELARKLVAESEKEIKEIGSSLVEERKTKPGFPVHSRLLNFVGKAETFASRVFGLELYAGKNCTSCGTCWSNCPVKNIENNNGKPRFGFKCLMCMRCIYNCPEQAISPRFSKFIPIKQGYSLSEYLEE